jgi:signal transduction histidine kinase
MSEIATGVLHNVGNVLNSVNVSAALLTDQLRKSAFGDLAKVVKALEPHAQDLPGFLAKDPKGKHLLPLLKSISEQLSLENERMQKEVGTLSEGIEHVKHLVKTQQGYAGRSGVQEVVTLASQVDAALGFAEKAASVKAKPIEVIKDYENLAPCRIERHRLMEILVNLIQNARQATVEFAEEPRITVRVRTKGADKALIEVQDNGMGIAPENLARIFTHGFTTKKNGHGFGLHSSANAAREMGGALTARSDGPGKGATFVLEIPFKAVETKGVAA